MRNVLFIKSVNVGSARRLNGEIANRARVETAWRIILNLLHFFERNFLGHVAIVGWRLVGGRCSGHCHSCDFAEANAVMRRASSVLWSPELPRLAGGSRNGHEPSSSFFTNRYRHQRQCIARRAELLLLLSKWCARVVFYTFYLRTNSLTKSRGSFVVCSTVLGFSLLAV
jgi:hypothetical protein